MVSTLIWSTKESMLKALQVGLRWDTRRVEVVRIEGSVDPPLGKPRWWRMQVQEPTTASRTWVAWWQRREDSLMTIAAMAHTAVELDSVELSA